LEKLPRVQISPKTHHQALPSQIMGGDARAPASGFPEKAAQGEVSFGVSDPNVPLATALDASDGLGPAQARSGFNRPVRPERQAQGFDGRGITFCIKVIAWMVESDDNSAIFWNV